MLNSDWQAGSVKICSQKSRRERVLPLPEDVGRALAAYLRTSHTMPVWIFDSSRATFPVEMRRLHIKAITKYFFKRAGVVGGSAHGLSPYRRHEHGEPWGFIQGSCRPAWSSMALHHIHLRQARHEGPRTGRIAVARRCAMTFEALSQHLDAFLALKAARARRNPYFEGDQRRRLRYEEGLLRSFISRWQQHGCPWPIRADFAMDWVMEDSSIGKPYRDEHRLLAARAFLLQVRTFEGRTGVPQIQFCKRFQASNTIHLLRSRDSTDHGSRGPEADSIQSRDCAHHHRPARKHGHSDR